MDIIFSALNQILTFDAIVVILLGTFVGMFVGMLPGLSSTMGVALCIPFTFTMSSELSLILLGAVYVSSVYAGSIPAILLRTPGTDASIATSLDGYPLTQAGKGVEAIAMSTIASLFGGLFSVVILLTIAPTLSKFSLVFGPQDYTLLAVFGLITIVGVISGSPLKGLFSASIGLVLAAVGLDNFTGLPRFTYGVSELYDGVPLIPVLIGLFSVSQAINLCSKKVIPGKTIGAEIKGKMPTLKIYKKCLRTLFRSSIIGSIIGILPGAGTSIAAFISYNEAKRKSLTPENFGKGELEGIAASESANNAVTGGTLIPTLTLGIPGNAVTAVFIGGLTIHGMIPGPALFTEHAETTYTLILSLFFSNIAFAIIGLYSAKYLVHVNRTPPKIIAPMIIVFSLIGAYALRNNMFDVWLALLFGIIGYFMEKADYPTAPLVIALILGPILEVNFRRSMQISNWDILTYVQSPISIGIMALIILSITIPLYKKYR